MVNKKGFTLIEILVVIGILAIIVVVGSTSFFNLLKGSTKTRTANLVKQNGNYALEVMGRMIRNARGISAYDEVEGKEITIENPDGFVTTFTCRDDESDIASNGASLISSEVKVKSCASVFDVVRGETGLQPDVVTINFTLSQAQEDVRPEEEVSIVFKTTVVLRNIAGYE